jgi:CMP-2-keto-3-deoxyoctulosonic acid synthetase
MIDKVEPCFVRGLKLNFSITNRQKLLEKIHLHAFRRKRSENTYQLREKNIEKFQNLEALRIVIREDNFTFRRFF